MNKCRRTVVQCGILSQMLPLSSEKKQNCKSTESTTKVLYNCTTVHILGLTSLHIKCTSNLNL